MSSALKIVATPIGNIRDISLRALDEIKRADIIFAEDTRHSLKLIQALSIDLKPGCRLVSCNANNERERIELIKERLTANDHVLLLSDAGCPTISDPGSLVVQGVAAAGFLVEIIPGPSAMSAALMGAGLNTARFFFLGFLPRKGGARKNLLLSAADAGAAIVIYESPLRVKSLLLELFSLLGSARVVVARELTKLHETFHRGQLGSLLNPPLVEKGECVVVVEVPAKRRVLEEEKEDPREFIVMKLAKGQSPKTVAELVANKFKIKKKAAYDLVLQEKTTGLGR